MKQRFTLLLSWLVLGLPFFSFGQAPRLAQAPASAPTDKVLQFIENKNQWDASVAFMAPIPGGNLYLQENSFLYSFYDNSSFSHHDGTSASLAPRAQKIKTHAYSVSFLSAGKPVSITGSGVKEGYRNYFIGNDPARWASQVQAYEEVSYKQLYQGIDLQLYEKNGHLKYDFLVAPHTDPKIIRMAYKGADQLALVSGALHIQTSLNKVIENKPVAYQHINGQRKNIPCRFILEGNIVSFDFPQGYDSNQPLVIDPELVFSTFSGSTSDNWGFTATYDQEGNMYSGGIVNNGGFPASVGAADRFFNNGDWDIGILKFKTNATGAASLLYATYLGGADTEVPSSLVVNSSNELLVLGATGSANFPTTPGAHDRFFSSGTNQTPLDGISFRQGSDLFVARLRGDGTQLLAATFLGGTRNEGILSHAVNPTTHAVVQPIHPLNRNYGDQFRGDILTDAANNIYIVSSTQSFDFPTLGAFQSASGGGSNDAVVAKFTPGLAMTWSSYLGGSGADAGYSIQLDSNQNIFIAGGTTSPGLAGTGGAFKPTFGGGQADGFVAKISNSGSTLHRLSYIGTNNYDNAFFVQLDEANNVFLLGQTLGSYPVSAGTYTNPKGKQFIQKLNNDLTSGLMSTVFGSTDPFEADFINIAPTAFLVDNCNRIYICGWGGENNSSNTGYTNGTTRGLPVTSNAYQATTDSKDFYLMLLSRDAGTLEYATFFGGNSSAGEHVDGGTSRFDKRGFVYQAVCGGCRGTSNFPTTPGAWSQTNRATNCNNAAFKFDFNIITAVAGSDQTVCANQAPIQLSGFSPATGGTWSGTGVSAGGVFTPAPGMVGTVTLTYTVANGSCISTSTKTMTVNPADPISFTGLPQQVCQAPAPATLVPSVAGATFSGPGITGNVFNPVAAGNGTHTITASFTNSFGCTVTSSQVVRVNLMPAVLAGPDQAICADGAAFQLSGFSPAGGTWSGTGVTAAGLFTPATAKAGTHVLTYTYNNGMCTATATKTLTVHALPVVSFTALPPRLCLPAAALTLSGTPAGGTFSGPGMNGNVFNPATAGPGNHTLVYTFVTAEGCTLTSSQAIAVGTAPVVAAGPDERICSGSFPLMLSGFSPAGGTWSGTGVRADGLFTPSEAIAGTHVLTYTVTNGFCTTAQTKTVIVDPTIKFTQGPPLALCPDGQPSPLTNIIPAGGTWSGPGVGAGGLFNPAAAGPGNHLLTYFVQVGACSGISTQDISVSAPPVVQAAAVPTECGSATSIQGFAPFTASFTNTTTGATSYLWEFGDGATSTEATPSHQYTANGNYEVYLTCFYGTGGCRVRQKIAVAQVDKKEMIPNVFTPNGDGLNETFVPRVTCLSTDLKIFNRWGKLVFEQKNYQNDWAGHQVADGIYYYQLTSAKGQIWKGWVEIIR
ncbi:MAG: gliding motility-associated C-terminal domain-containing protein [Adhaeribacter sp.]